MTVFGNYAQFYDELYKDKNYSTECDFLEKIFQKFSTAPVKNILDLGCGTGGHVLDLAQRGFQLSGVDQSADMLLRAKLKAAALPNLAYKPEFLQGDIRTIDLGRTFDVVVSMFAVMGYMITNADLLAAFHSARRHLRPDRLFIFDAWFGPAVLGERPSDRYKIVERGAERIIRFVHSELDVIANTVKVHYKVLHIAKQQVLSDVNEVHEMRFLFPQEILYFFESTDLQIKMFCPFLHVDDKLKENDWNMVVVAQAK